MCSYKTYSWNTIERTAVDFQFVNRAYSSLTKNEHDPITGCTICDQDQVEISVATLPAFKVCYLIASELRTVLENLISQGAPVFEVVGYRVGKTRGEVDEWGNRTEFSNHSFGVAFDINPDSNGLYDDCIKFNEQCRLIKGGQWHPDRSGSLTENGTTVLAMENIGFIWGGKITGKQKDFMHFSLTGY